MRPDARRLVAAGVRLPRPRRAPALRRAADRDADRARAALRQLGPGRHRRREALRRAGAGDRRARRWWRSAYAVGDVYASVPDDDWDRTGLRSDGSVFTIAPLGRYHLPRRLPPPARRGAAGRAGHVGVLRRLRRGRTPPAPARCPTWWPATSPASSTPSVPRRACSRSAAARGRDALALEQIGLSVRRTDISAGVRRGYLRIAGYVADQLDPLRDDLTDPLRGGAPYDGVWANASLLHVARESLPVVLRPPGRRHPARRHAAPDPQGGRRRALVGARPRRRAALLHLLARGGAARGTSREAGWGVDEVRRGESEPVDRPSEAWLAVFATRG